MYMYVCMYIYIYIYNYRICMYVSTHTHTDFNMHLHLPIHKCSREAAPDPDLLGDALVEGEEAASVTYAGLLLRNSNST